MTFPFFVLPVPGLRPTGNKIQMKKKGKIHIGTSGWSYKHWAGTFYHEKIKSSEQLDQYQASFDTVEINSSFYGLPAAATIEKWEGSVRHGFIFSVKANRYITHLKKLHDAGQALNTFLDRITLFGKTLGPILFQLPPNLKYDPERLKTFTGLLPAHYRYVFEFRNETWYTDEVYQILSQHNCSFCIFELAGKSTPEPVTADFVYVRLHGPGKNKYQGSYSKAQLNKWADKCKAWQKQSLDVYLYFDNDEKGYAGFNAASLIDMLS